jgi:2-polyprenyl-3-methyl-5-hydroxy-6-metoxy-1,4-benzoquinol methylase
MLTTPVRPTAPALDRLESCPCCAGRSFVVVDTPAITIGQSHFGSLQGSLRVCRCHECGVQFTNPRPESALLGAFYNTEGYDCHDPAFDAASSPRSDAVRLDLVQSAVESRSPFLLDIGPGAGHLLRHARERGWRVAGLEVGRPARERLEQEGVTTYADLDAWRAAAQQADVVTMVHVLEHMTEPAATLRRVQTDALRRGGVCYIEVPNVDSLRARLAVSFLRPLWRSNAGRYLAFPIHLTYFNHRALRRLLRAQGFEILRMGNIGIGLFLFLV